MDKNHQGPKMKTWKMKMPAGVGVHGAKTNTKNGNRM